MKSSEAGISARTSSRIGSPGSHGEDNGIGLAEQLTRLAADPGRVDSLHAVLGPFCHQSRNILNSLKMSLYLAKRQEPRPSGEVWEEVERSYGQVECFYDRLQMIWRPMPLTLLRMSLALLLEDRRRSWVQIFAAQQGVLELTAPGEEDVGEYDPNLLGLGLDSFVEWRAGAGSRIPRARLTGWADSGCLHLEWVEPSPGAGEEPARAPEGTESLALPLLGRVISAHGGEMELVPQAGYHVRMSWPRVARLPH